MRLLRIAGVLLVLAVSAAATVRHRSTSSEASESGERQSPGSTGDRNAPGLTKTRAIANDSRPVARVGVIEKPPTEDEYLHELSRQRALDKPFALALARKGDEWYSRIGPAAEARNATAITLLVDLGKMDEARRETLDFIATYPESPYRPLVQGVTGIHPRPRGPGVATSRSP